MREIVLDTETTGLDPASGHRIVEIGAVELVNYVPTGKTYHQYVNPERDMPAEAFQIHGLSADFLCSHPLFRDICEAFEAFIDDAKLIIHNAAFDIGFLNHELGLLKRATILPERVVDTMELARRRHPTGPFSLDALCRRYGIDNTGREKHGALLDSQLLADVYLELIGGRQTTMALSTTSLSGMATSARRPAPARPQPLPPRLSDEEQLAHAGMVDALGEAALWRRYLSA